MQVHHIALRTTCIDRLGRFYEEVVGLQPVGGTAGYSRWYRLGSAVLMIEKRTDDEVPLASGSMEFLGLSATTTERGHLRDRLQLAGVLIEDETEYTTYFRDPDGRRLGVSHFDFSALYSGDPASA